MARVSSPPCHVYRIVPQKAIEGHSSMDHSMKKIAHMEVKCRTYLQTCPREILLLRHTLELLFQSKSCQIDSDALKEESKLLTKTILDKTHNQKYQNFRNTIARSVMKVNVLRTAEDEEEELNEYLAITSTTTKTKTNHRKQKGLGMSIISTNIARTQAKVDREEGCLC